VGTALVHKSVTDLTRRKARAVFAVATLALAVGSIGIFALPPLADRAMRDAVSEARLADLTLRTKPLALTDADLAALAKLPNVEGVEPRSGFFTRVYIGERRADAVLVGVRDFTRQEVDVVRVTSGTAPGATELLTDVQNERQGKYAGAAGDVVRVIAADGTVRPVRITGTGRNLELGQEIASEDWIVLYGTPATVAALRGGLGYDSFAFRLRDANAPAVQATVAAVRRSLGANTSFESFTALPSVRARGSWPGQQELDDFSTVLSIVALLALLSAVVLIASTMTTLVGEQTREIGTMKALGARRRQVAGSFLLTALLLGALGAVIGSLLGLLIANALARFFLSTFFGVDPSLAVDAPMLLASVAVGLLAPPLAALPAIRRGTALSVREAIEATGSATGGQGALDRLLRHVGFLPRAAQIGLRGIGRRKRRSLATALQVTLAVATLLAMLGLGTGVARTVQGGWSTHGWQIWVSAGLTRPLDTRAERLIRATPGVGRAEPLIVTEAELGGDEAFVWATGAQTLLRYRLVDGRWYSPAEARTAGRVAVVERNIARATGTQVGDVVRLTTPAGAFSLRVIGVAANQQEDGTVVYVPLSTVRRLLGVGNVASAYWVATTSSDHGLIDRTTTRLEDRLTAAGYNVGTEITYVAERDEEATNRTLTTTVTVLGFLIVAISLVGLANAITMSVLERTREIGVLRCIGARGRDVRRIFATEGLVLALAGWLAGVPLGYAFERFLVWMIREELNVVVSVAFPASHVVLALAGTIVLALLIMLAPLRRAVRFRPGDALRYA